MERAEGLLHCLWSQIRLVTFAGKKQKLGPVFSQGVRSSSHKSLTLAVMALSLGGTWSLSG